MGRGQGVVVWVGETGEQELERVGFDAAAEGAFDENWLQKLIHRHPLCLPLREIDPVFEGAIPVCMELPTAHGFVDNLLITADGNIVIVEAKLWRNPEARRKVVAQALDYAACLFEMSYSELELAALKGDFGAGAKPVKLYDLFPESEALSEAEFVDQVSRNLRKGRILVLVVGDGIRADFERLAAGLQAHAGFHFTFALVELAVYRAPTGKDLIVQPRTLGKTVMVERGIVHIDDRRVSVTLPAVAEDRAGKAVTVSISSEQFLEAIAARDAALPDRLKGFFRRLEDCGVYPSYQRSLNLRWDPPAGKPISLGYIQRDGQVWTDTVELSAPKELGHAYVEDLAATLGMEVEKSKLDGRWHVRTNGKSPRLEAISGKLDLWADCIGRFVEALRTYYADRDA